MIKLFPLYALWVVGGATVGGEKFVEDLKAVTEDILKSYFSGYKCIVYVTGKSEWDLRDEIDSSIIIVNVEPENSSMVLNEVYETNCRGFIVQRSGAQRSAMVAEMIKAHKRSLSNRSNRRYLFLPVTEHDNCSQFLQNENMYFMPEIVFANPTGIGFALLSHTYFDGYRYDVLKQKLRVLDTWRSGIGFEKYENLYPDRFSNLRGKKIKFAVMNYSPYTLVIKERDSVIYDGLETRLAAQFVKLKNGSWTGQDHPIHLWGDVFENGTGNGVVGSVFEHKADIGFGGVYQWHCDVLDCSYPYVYAGITCLVPKPLLLSGWYTILLPFQNNVWIVISAVYVSCSLYVFFVSVVMQRIKSNGGSQKIALTRTLLESFFNTFRLQLEQAKKETRTEPPLFVFFKTWTVYCFFVVLCWQGGLASFLTVPRYEDPINEARDLTSRWPQVQWGANHIDWTKSIRQSSEPDLVHIVKNFVVLDDSTLRRRVKTRDFGFFMERLPNGHYGLNDYIDEEGMKFLRLMENNIYTANCVMVLPKCSPYLEHLDKMLFRMFETGLIQKLEIQISLERINNRLQNMIKASTEKTGPRLTPLLIGHIHGAIYIYASGITLSITVYILEIIFFKLNLKKQIDMQEQITKQRKSISKKLFGSRIVSSGTRNQ